MSPSQRPSPRERIERGRRKYEVGDAHPDDYMPQAPEQKADWDSLLNQIK